MILNDINPIHIGISKTNTGSNIQISEKSKNDTFYSTNFKRLKSDFDIEKYSEVNGSSSTIDEFIDNYGTLKSNFKKLQTDKEKVLEIENYILTMLEFDYISPGIISQTEKYIRNELLNNRSLLIEALSSIGFKYMGNIEVIYSIASILSNFEFDDLYPNNLGFANICTSNDSIILQEAGLRLLENWRNDITINILKNTRPFQVEWVENYRLEIIKDLERELES